jgi:hypothetical protein
LSHVSTCATSGGVRDRHEYTQTPRVLPGQHTIGSVQPHGARSRSITLDDGTPASSGYRSPHGCAERRRPTSPGSFSCAGGRQGCGR